ncbi:MAG: NADH-ubiquinone oxidoreductase-F iron-sulfur binding region domain-containing protein [Myxococcota bacterium]|jgi:NADH-quinone oxidoreductase subunit F
MIFKNTAELALYRKTLLEARPAGRRSVAVCAGTGCKAFGSFKLIDAFRDALKKAGLDGSVGLRPTGCHGFCERGPLVLIFPEGVLYQRVKPQDVEEIVRETVAGGKVIDRLLVEDPRTGERFTHEHDVPFYALQKRLVLANNGLINPDEIDDYIATGGYGALAKALAMGGGAVLEEVKRSGLRGRGGAGFPAGRKWEICAGQDASEKYIICNADEGDPGAFMDRSVVEGNPHSVIEGMLIGALAIGATAGFVYIRQEYPLAVERLRRALGQAREKGLLGKGILGSALELDITVKRGGGAFVCGEESALIASIEGRRGVPRRRPPYPAVSGLWGKPTNINNVETWATVPIIINNGADWFAGIGTGGSKGTKIFSLVGKVCNTGLVEVPMGMTLREVIFGIGGGIPKGKQFKAVQTGGPSGGCLPASRLDIPIDFDTLVREGSMMGSGGMIVMDEDTCMVDVARYFLGFLRSESCGNCTSCRDGVASLHRLLTDICEGRGTPAKLKLVEELAKTVKLTSLCALGQTAVNPVLSTLAHFRDEYEAHITQKRCPAHVCKPLITFTVNEKCNGCHVCARQCPQKCIAGEMKGMHTIDGAACIKCGVCRDVCRFDAINVD